MLFKIEHVKNFMKRNNSFLFYVEKEFLHLLLVYAQLGIIKRKDNGIFCRGQQRTFN